MTTGLDCDVAVIGGGMVGIATALECVDRGLKVTLVDPQDPRGRASYGNAGVISRGSILPVSMPSVRRNILTYLLNRSPAIRVRYGALPEIIPWGLAFLRHCNEPSVRAIASALNPLAAACYDEHMRRAAELSQAHRIRRHGWYKLFRSEADFAASRLERDVLAELNVKTEVLDSGQIAAEEPALKRRFARALQVPETGSIERPGELVEAYARAFADRGGRTVAAVAGSLADDGERVTIRWNGGALLARQAVIAAGAQSARLLRPLGYRIPLIAERGYHRHYAMPDAARLNRPVYDTAGGYVLAPMGDSVRLTTGSELGRADDPPSPVQLERVLPEARTTLGFGEPLEVEPWMGSRPATPDSLPVIGRARRHPNIILAFGHGHIGMSLGPITGRIVADIIGQRRPVVPIEPYAPERFG